MQEVRQKAKPANFGLPYGVPTRRERSANPLIYILKVWGAGCLLFFLTFLIATLLSGCATEVIEPEEVLTKDDLEEIGLSWCKAQGYDCGHVWECGNTLQPDLPETVEVCVWDEIPIAEPSAYYGGTCEPTNDSRFEGLPNLCFWCCGDMCPRGCNAFQGCYCPATVMP